jgi:hypothetical protein
MQNQYDNYKIKAPKVPIIPNSPPQYPGQNDNYDEVLKNIFDVAPEIAELAEKIPVKLRNSGLSMHKAKVCLILDISQSMQNPNKFFRGDNGRNKVSSLVNNVLALSCFFDDDNEVEIIPFGRNSYPITKVSLNNYQGVTDEILTACGGFSDATNYAEPLKALREYYFKSTEKPKPGPHSSDLPVFAIFVTDGDCNNEYKGAAELQFRYMSQFPAFFKVLALKGKQENAIFDFLNKLDDAPVVGDNSKVPENLKHYIDNVDFVQLNDPDDICIELLVKEYLGYLHEAYTEKGLLDQDPCIDTNKIDNAERMRAVQQKKGCCIMM